MNSTNSIVQFYHSGPNNRRVGVLVAKKTQNGYVVVGWSKCRTSNKGNIPADVFSTEKALEIANSRIDKHLSNKHLNKCKIPAFFQQKNRLWNFISRCCKYFKVYGNQVYTAW